MHSPIAMLFVVVATSLMVDADTNLNPDKGSEIGMQFEAYLSPDQEGGEEQDTPPTVPKKFQSSEPSQTRAQRVAAGHKGHGKIRFKNDFSSVLVDVKIEGINVNKINLFHIHCGDPGILGPILIDFAVVGNGNFTKNFKADGTFSVEIKNEHIVKTAQSGHQGPFAAFTFGCIIAMSPTLQGVQPAKVTTVAGMAQLALNHQLYFNVHTKAQTYFGDIRGQLHPIV